MNSQYAIHPLVKIHNASDQSGILLYSGFTGNTLRLSSQFAALISQFASKSKLTKNEIMQQLIDIDSEQADNVWHTLVSHFILYMEPNIEAE